MNGDLFGHRTRIGELRGGIDDGAAPVAGANGPLGQHVEGCERRADRAGFIGRHPSVDGCLSQPPLGGETGSNELVSSGQVRLRRGPGYAGFGDHPIDADPVGALGKGGPAHNLDEALRRAVRHGGHHGSVPARDRPVGLSILRPAKAAGRSTDQGANDDHHAGRAAARAERGEPIEDPRTGARGDGPGNRRGSSPGDRRLEPRDRCPGGGLHAAGRDRSQRDPVIAAGQGSRRARLLPGRLVPVLLDRDAGSPSQASRDRRGRSEPGRGVSPDPGATRCRPPRSSTSPFRVLSDERNRVAETFGLAFTLPESLRQVYQGFGIDLPVANGDDTFRLPVPATYVIAPDGTVVWRFAHPDHTKRAEPDDVLSARALSAQWSFGTTA